MEEISYEPFRQDRWHEDIGSYSCYGIRAVSPDGKCLGEVEDAVLTLSEAQKLADACTKALLDPVHLMDVVLDWIG